MAVPQQPPRTLFAHFCLGRRCTYRAPDGGGGRARHVGGPQHRPGGRFFALTSPLGKDPAFQQRLAAAAVGSLGSGDRIPAALAELVRPVLEKAAQSLTGLPGYPDAWAETLRKSHRLSFAAPGTLPPQADGATSLTLDVAPLVGLVAKQISDATTFPLQAPDQVLIHIGQSDQRQLIDGVCGLRPDGLRGGRGGRHRLPVGPRCGPPEVDGPCRDGGRRAGAGRRLWKLAGDAAGGAVAGTSSGNEVAEIFKREFVAASSASFDQWILAAAVAGGALLVTGILVRAVSGRRR